MAKEDISTPSLLQNMWSNQKSFNQNFVDYESLTDKKKVEHTKEYALLMVDEMMELVRETNWKNHRKDKLNLIQSNMKEEWIDVFKYWLSIGLIWGFSPEDMIEEYQRKSAVVEQRYKQEKQLDFDSAKIVGVDIDGVLAAYPDHFIDFINKRAGTNYKTEELTQYNLYQAFDLPEDYMRKLKDEFRQTGEKRNIPVIDGAREFLQNLKAQGYHVVLLSARPYKKYRRIFADTQEWLNKNGLVHDAILWDEDKCNRLIREFGEGNVKFFVEDHIKNANDVAKLTKVYLLNKKYNQGDTVEGVVRVDNLNQIIQMEVENDGE